MSLSETPNQLTSARLIFAAAFFSQFVANLYAYRLVEVPSAFDVLSPIAFVWLIWWWLRDDSRRRGITWVLDLGMFLWLAWFIVLPYHLFKTRGHAAFIPILALILTYLLAAASAAIVSTIIGS
ncbi:MAG: hypothetical protein WBO10_04125 [Pyrinomonadaceae bacterium]